MRTYVPEIMKGVRIGSPIALGYFPIAVAFGALAVEANLLWYEAVLMSVIVFAGASQFMAAGMLLSGAGPIQIITAVFFVNLRHLIMSLAVTHRLQSYPKIWKGVLSLGVTDETFALITLQDSDGEAPLAPVTTSALMTTAYLGWVTGTALGSFSAQWIPPEITTGMTVGLYALFIGLLVPHVKKSVRIGGIALSSMALNTGFTYLMDPGWAIVLSTILAAGVGVFLLEEEA
jgi:4-azaleucine resistance transporter AzlC